MKEAQPSRKVEFPKHIQVFRGTESQKEAMMFLYQLGIYRDCSNHKPRDFLVGLVNLWEPKSVAAKWHERVGRHANDWDTWRRLFQSEYGFLDGDEQQHEREVELMKSRQTEKQSFASYSREFGTVVDSLGLVYTPRQLLQKVYRNMSARYKIHIPYNDALTLSELEVRVKYIEANEVSNELQKMGYNPDDLPHVRTIEQLAEFKDSKKKDKQSANPAPAKPAPAKPVQFKQPPAPNPAPRNPPAEKPHQDTPRKRAATKGGSPPTKKQPVTKPAQKAYPPKQQAPGGSKPKGSKFNQPATPEELEKKNLPDNCYEGDNVAGFEGDPTKHFLYKPGRKCRLCGLEGYNQWLCVHCNTAAEISANRLAFKNKMTGQNLQPAAEAAEGDAAEDVSVNVVRLPTNTFANVVAQARVAPAKTAPANSAPAKSMAKKGNAYWAGK